MNLRTFIERPVLSAVISITIVVVGIIGLFSLPVEQYPDIAPPTIMVSTTYYGASAETLQKSVIAPLEEAINGVEDMTYMTSSATMDEYRQYESHHKRRLSMKPGITGLWQVSGRSDIDDFEEVVKLDVQYIDNWSIWMDIYLLFRTVGVVFDRKGAK